MKRLIATISFLLMASQVWAGSSPFRIDGGDTVVAQTDITVAGTAVLIAASNSSRTNLNCTTSADVRWGHSLVLATKGQLIPASGSVTIQNTASIYMIAVDASATVSCTEESSSTIASGGPVFSP